MIRDRPRILYVGLASPYGEQTGIAQRTRQNIELLSRFADVTLLGVSKNWPSPPTTDTLTEKCKFAGNLEPQSTKSGWFQRLVGVLPPRRLTTHYQSLSQSQLKKFHQLASNHDAIWLHTIKVANTIGQFRFHRSILDADDFPTAYCLPIIRRDRSIKRKFEYTFHYAHWKLKESDFSIRFDAFAVCNNRDRYSFGSPNRSIVIPNGIGFIPQPRSRRPIGKTLGMIGNFGYELNRDAMVWYLKHCWPDVKAACPSAELRLIGKGSEDFTRADLSVLGLGYLDNPNTEMQKWTAMIAPIRFGGGSSVKIGQALALGLPTITTPHGARGYENVNKKTMLIANSAFGFSKSCIAILTSQSMADFFSKGALEYCRSALAPEPFVRHLESLVERVKGSPTRPSYY